MSEVHRSHQRVVVVVIDHVDVRSVHELAMVRVLEVGVVIVAVLGCEEYRSAVRCQACVALPFVLVDGVVHLLEIAPALACLVRLADYSVAEYHNLVAVNGD